MQSLRERNLVVVDIETTGSNPFEHEALAIAIVPIERTAPAKQVFISHSSYKWNEFAKQNFKKFEAEWRAKAVPASVACLEIEQYLRDVFGEQLATPIGHNVGFDVAFLRKVAFQGGRSQLAGISHRAIDTHTLLYLLLMEGKVPASATSSDGALKYFGIEVPNSERHTALGDAVATRDLFEKLLPLLDVRTEPEALKPSTT